MARRLLLLNGLATLGVVLNHSSSWGFIAMFWWTHRYLPVTVPNFDQMGGLSYYALRVVEQLITFSVPAFLFVSGFFIRLAAGGSQSAVSLKGVGVRIRNLVIPYLFWSVVIFIGDFLQGRTYSAVKYLKLLAFGQTIPAYYYIPLLCQLYLFSPLIVLLAKNRWKPLLFVSALVQLGVQGLRYPYFLGVEIPALKQMIEMTPGWFFPGKIFWFTFGVVAGFHLQPLRLWLARIKWGLLAVVGILGLLGILEWEALLHFSTQDWFGYYETILDSLYAGTFILCFLAFDKVSIPFPRKTGELGTKSFGVYLVHSPVLEFVSRGVYHIAPWIFAYQILFQPMLVFLGLGVPLLLMAVVRRSPASGFYKYIFG